MVVIGGRNQTDRVEDKYSIIPLSNEPKSYHHFVGYRGFLESLTPSVIVICGSFSATIRLSLSFSLLIFVSLASSSPILFTSLPGKGTVEPITVALRPRP